MPSLLQCLLAAAGLLCLSTAQSHSPESSECVPHSRPNPLASQFPANVTGTINTTLAVLPIPLKLARSIVPAQYQILNHAWSDLLPYLPKDMYPALLYTVRDHDVGFGEYKIDDFSRASIEFPFIDLLGDGSTSFRYSPAILLTSTHALAIQGAEVYGTKVYPAVFDPPCNAYEYVSKNVGSARPGSTYLTSKSNDSNSVVLDSVFSTSHVKNAAAFPMQFFINATNQPIFTDGKSCDMYTTFYNTSLAQGTNAPVPVSGTVRAKLPAVFKEEMLWADAIGIRVDLAFVENGPVSCQGLKGYSGPGDQKVELATEPGHQLGSEVAPAQNSTYTPSYGLESVLGAVPITSSDNIGT